MQKSKQKHVHCNQKTDTFLLFLQHPMCIYPLKAQNYLPTDQLVIGLKMLLSNAWKLCRWVTPKHTSIKPETYTLHGRSNDFLFEFGKLFLLVHTKAYLLYLCVVSACLISDGVLRLHVL